MMRALARALACLALGLVLAAPSLRAAPPVFPLSDEQGNPAANPTLAADARGGFVAAWNAGHGLRARLFDDAGRAVGPSFRVSERTDSYEPPAPRLAADRRGFSVVWNFSIDFTGPIVGIVPTFRRFDASGRPLRGETIISAGGVHPQHALDVATTAEGRSLVLVSAILPGEPGQGYLYVVPYDAAGRQRGAPIRIARVGSFVDNGGRIVATAGGGFAVAWIEASAGSEPWNFFVRSFDRADQPRDDAVALASVLADTRGWIDLAARPGGGLLALWNPGLAPGSSLVAGSHHLARLLNRDGQPIGAVIQVESSRLRSGSSPAVAAVAPDGTFAVSWFNSGQGITNAPPRLLLQRFTADGRRLGGEELLKTLAVTFDSPSITALTDGDFVLATRRFVPDEPQPLLDSLIEAQRVRRARPGADACVFDGRRLACDTAHNGGPAETGAIYASNAQDEPLFGDLDGDGRDELCLVREDRFRCDLDHAGDPMELVARFPRPSPAAVPLAGDLDGEGRDELCWFDGASLACDTAHNGGSAEVVVKLDVSITGRPVLGDLDGDGDDELCRVEGRRFRCDLAHDGGAAELEIRTHFGGDAEAAFLADFDGDGDDDPCFAAAGVFACDTAHDGGRAETSVRFGTATMRPLMGNIDGI